MNNEAFETFEVEQDDRRYVVELHYDTSAGAPWENQDFLGAVEGAGRREAGQPGYGHNPWLAARRVALHRGVVVKDMTDTDCPCCAPSASLWCIGYEYGDENDKGGHIRREVVPDMIHEIKGYREAA